MKTFGIGLAAALAVAAAGFGGVAALAKDPFDKKALERGMAEAPAIAQAAGVTCNVTQAAFVGSSKNKTDAGEVQSTFYEIACDQGLGFVLEGKAPGTPAAFDCFSLANPGADGKPHPLACKLPGNADLTATMAAYVAKTTTPCTVKDARSIGSSATKSFFEVACESGDGYVMSTGAPANVGGEIAMTSCLMYEPGGNIECKLTTREQQLAVIDTLNTAAANGCAIKDRRYAFATRSGARYFEVSCQDGKGFMYQQNADGSLAQSIECAKAANLDGGCRLTDALAAQTEQAGLYTDLSKKGGFNCDVSGYGLITSSAGKEVVELQCSNGPGKIGVFETSGAATFYDCPLAELARARCTLNKAPYDYSALTANLKALGKTDCTVSDSRVIGVTGAGRFYVETACSDGLPGWVMVYPGGTTKADEVLSCLQAKNAGSACKLPTNVRS